MADEERINRIETFREFFEGIRVRHSLHDFPEAHSKLLGQARPSDTSNTSWVTYETHAVLVMTHVVVANTTGSAATFRVMLDTAGSTFDESTALYWDVSVGANTSLSLSDLFWVLTRNAECQVRSGTGNALTFTAFGLEIHI